MLYLNYYYRITHVNGKTYDSAPNSGRVPVTEDQYKEIVRNVANGIPLEDIDVVKQLRSRIEDNVLDNEQCRLGNRRPKGFKAISIRLTDFEKRSMSKMKDHLEILDKPKESMNIYRSDGTMVKISWEHGVVECHDTKTGHMRRMSADDFLNF